MEKSVIGVPREDAVDGQLGGDVNELIHIEEEGPVRKEPRAMEAIIEQKKLVVVMAIELGLRPHVLDGHIAPLSPRLENGPNPGMHAARIVKHKVRTRAEEADVVGHPFTDTRFIYVAEDGGATVENVIRVWWAIESGFVEGLCFP